MTSDKTKVAKEVLTTDRNDFLFLLALSPRNGFFPAQTPQKRAAENSAAADDRRLVIYGYWLAAASLLLQAILAVIGPVAFS